MPFLVSSDQGEWEGSLSRKSHVLLSGNAKTAVLITDVPNRRDQAVTEYELIGVSVSPNEIKSEFLKSWLNLLSTF